MITPDEALYHLKTLTYNLPYWAAYDSEIAEAANSLLAFIKQVRKDTEENPKGDDK